MNRQEICSRVLVALNDSPTVPLAWSLDEIRQSLQEAQEVLSEEVDAVTRTFFIPLEAGVMLYSLVGLDRAVQTIWRIWTRTRTHRLWSTSMPELDGHYERWQTVTGEPEWWFTFSWDVFGVWPVPTSGGGVLEVECFCWPAPILDDGDEPETNDPDHDVLVEYMLAQGQLKQWDVARALEILTPLSARYKDSQARAGLRQVQERFFQREEQPR